MCGTYDDGLKFLENGSLQLAVPMHNSGLASAFQRQGSPISSGSDSGTDTGALSDPELSSPISSSPDEAVDVPLSPTASEPSTPGKSGPLHIMFLGSSIGNFDREGATAFLRSLPLRAGEGDTLLLGLDHDSEKWKIEEAHNDKEGYTKKFIMNGLKTAGRTLGDEGLFREEDWEYVNRYNPVDRRHEAFYRSKRPQTIRDPSRNVEFHFAKDELLKVEESLKVSLRPAAHDQ